MASFFTRALDTITPWNRGGELQRRKKREEEQQQFRNRHNYTNVRRPAPSVSVSEPNQDIDTPQFPTPQRPENLFRDLNQNLMIGKSNNIIDVTGNQNLQIAPKPRPGTVIEPTIQKPKQSLWDRARDVVDANTEADKYRRAIDEKNRLTKQFTDKGVDPARARQVATRVAESNIDQLDDDTRQSRIADRARGVGSVGANLAGGLVGVGKGIVQLPSAALSIPKLVRLGSAKVTGNKKAEENIANDKGVLTKLAERYDRFVNPVTRRLTETELATDRAAEGLAPWAPNYVKPGVKVLSNIIPIEAAAAGVSGLSKAKNARKLIKESEAAVGTAGTAGSTSRVVNIPVRRSVDVVDEGGEAINVPIRDNTLQGEIIRELSGDAPNVTRVPTRDEVAAQRAIDDFNNQLLTKPDQRIEGVTPRTTEPYKLSTDVVKGSQDELIDEYADLLKEVGEGNGTQLVPNGEGGYYRTSNNFRTGDTAGKRMSKADWREEAEKQLRNGKAESSLQKAFDEAADPEIQALLAKGEPVDAPDGRPITVKEVRGIPVTDETVVPTGLPETPGTVRATTQTSPMQAKSEAVANAPVAAGPVRLPAEVQNVLDNPKQFSKRQVAAARNQRKLARAMAKTQEQTAEAMERINTVSPAAQSGEGFVPTGEFAKSQNGGTYQKASRKAEMEQAVQETANMSPGDVLQTARSNQAETGGFTKRDIRNVAALFEQKRLPRGSAEWNEARQILKEDGTVWGQQGALRNYTMRRTASANELISRYESKIYRLADDPTKIDGKLFDEVEAAETAYTVARDDALAAYNRFTEAPTTANAKLYHAAQDAADKADKTAKMTEYKVANKALKGNKDVNQVRELEKMANEADMYQMDAVDASMLSGTGTFVRNFVNAAVGGVEEGLFGRLSARVAGKLTGESVGGGFGRGSSKGFGDGVDNLVDASKARAGNASKNPIEHLKNWSTTGNQLGDVFFDSQTRSNVLDHYTQLLKEQGYKGRELTDRASVMARQDPDDLARTYSATARVAAGLGAGITRNNKIETFVKNLISDTISGGNPNKFTEATGKLITRMTIGFPTAIGRSSVEGAKRFTLGAPTFIKAMMTKDPTARAILIKEGIKQAGSGSMVVPPLFYALGASGAITGAYPIDDLEERARWEREGITENSIKIGDSYFQLPAYLGAWAVPGLFYASLGRTEGDWKAAVADTAKIVPDLLPADQASKVIDVINGRTDLSEYMSQVGASAVRASTPAGALLNQIAKSLDPTKNDTNSGTNWENFIDKVMGGIPGVNNMASIPDKEDDAGNPIQNPGAIPLLFGAASATQGKGEERSAQIASEVETTIKGLSDFGVLNDPNLKEILDDTDKAIYDKIAAGKEVSEKEIKGLQEAFVKGVSSEGTDTAYLEREQYDTNLAVLKLKRELMTADKTVKPSSVKDIDTAIKRGEVYKDNTIPYEMISEYKSVGVEEWRKMGDPEDDEYDPDMYQKLWDIDQLMTKAGVSYKKGALDKNKFYQKESKAKGGKRGSGMAASSLSSEFGKLKAGDFAPSVRAYDTIDQQTGSVPIIRTVRPNIVHKITSSG